MRRRKGMSSLPGVTLYIPCYNVEKFISQSIKGVLNQSYLPKEVFVIDDGSSDRSAEVASRFPVELIRLKKNMGLGVVRHIGFKVARHDYVASLDADCVPDPEWLERLLIVLVSNPKAAGVGGRLVELYTETIADQWRATSLRQHHGETRREVEFLFGSNNIFRKDAVFDVGGYNLEFKKNYEDYDISKRLKERGYGLLYEPDAIARHLRQDTVFTVLKMWWNWNHPLPRGKTYSNLIDLGEKIRRNFHLSIELFDSHLKIKQYNVLYLDFLLPFFATLMDIKNYYSLRLNGTYIKFPNEPQFIKSLYLVAFQEMIVQMKLCKLPKELIDRAVADLSAIQLSEGEESAIPQRGECGCDDMNVPDINQMLERLQGTLQEIVVGYLRGIQVLLSLITTSSRLG
jgi:glycosyltransferase involved in cell wall biosynthesis